MNIPSSDDQRKFLMLYYRLTGSKAISSLDDIVMAANDREIKEMVVDSIPFMQDYERLNRDCASDLNTLLSRNNMPPFVTFLILNTKRLSRILKLARLKNEDDAIILRDAVEAGILDGEKLEKASILLDGWI